MSTPNPTPRRRLAVALVARDAAELLPDTLGGVRSLADEIVVLDAGSRDNTAEVARRAGARVIANADLSALWSDDFSAARNACAKQVTADWLLWLDAGERLTPEVGQALRKFVDQQADPHVAYLMMLTLPGEAGPVAGEQAARVRLVPNRRELRYVGRVNETLLPAVAQAGMRLERLDWRIERGSREHDPQVKAARAQRNLRLAKLELDRHGDQPELLLTVAQALASLGKHAKAVDFFRRALAMVQRGSTWMLEGYYGLLTALDHVEEGREAQLAACLEALEVYPLDAQLLCGMGSYMLAQSRPDLAVRSYRIAMRHGQIDPQAWHLADIAEVAAACLSLTLQLLDQEDEARQVLDAALAAHPRSQRLWRQMLQMHIKHGQSEAALAAVNHLPIAADDREPLRCAVRGAVLAGQRNYLAARPYLQTAYAAECRDPICLRWLAVTQISLGDLTAARPILDQWQALEPTNSEVTSYLSALTAAERTTPQRREPERLEPESLPTRPAGTRSRIRVDAGDSSPAEPVGERPMPAFNPVGGRSGPSNSTSS